MMNNSRQALSVTISSEFSNGMHDCSLLVDDITSSGAAGGTTYGAGCDYWEAWPLWPVCSHFSAPRRLGSTRDECVLLYLPVPPPPSNSIGLYARSLSGYAG